MNTTLHIPINKKVKEQAEIIVKEQGYSSLQEVLRVMVFSLAKGEIMTTLVNTHAPYRLTPQQEQHLAKREKATRTAITQGKAHSAHSVTEMMDILEDTPPKHEH